MQGCLRTVQVQHKLWSAERGWMGPSRPGFSSGQLGAGDKDNSLPLVHLDCKCFGMGNNLFVAQKSKQHHHIIQNHLSRLSFPAGDVLYEILQYIKTQRRALVCSPLLNSPFRETRSTEEGMIENSSYPSSKACPQLQWIAHIWGLKLSQLNPSHTT